MTEAIDVTDALIRVLAEPPEADEICGFCLNWQGHDSPAHQDFCLLLEIRRLVYFIGAVIVAERVTELVRTRVIPSVFDNDLMSWLDEQVPGWRPT